MPKGKRKVVKVNNYNRSKRKWTPLQQAVVPDEATKTGVIACAQNVLYTVFIKETTSPGFEMPNPDGSVEPMRIVHLIIIRNDRKAKEIRYAHKQRIKEELCGAMCEGVELFPAKWREQEMSQTHLWVLAPGASFPLGLFPENFGGIQTPADVTVSKEELEVFVVRGEDFIEVFANEEEAKLMYAKSEGELPAGKIERIGDVPTSDDGAAWTDGAKAKVANVIAKADALDKMNTPEVGSDVEMPFYDDGPDGLEEELGFVFDMSLLKKHAELVYGPLGTEEHIQTAEYMDRKLTELKEKREIQLEDATRIVGEKVAEKEVDEEAEAEAASDLAEFREKMVKKDDSKPN